MMNKANQIILPPGEFLAAELRERKMSLHAFAKQSGLHHEVLYEISQGTRKITPHTAEKIAKALGTSSQLWLKLEQRYQRSLK